MTPHPQATELMAMAADIRVQMQRIVRDLKGLPTATRWENCTQKEAMQLIAEGYGYSIVRVKTKPLLTRCSFLPELAQAITDMDAKLKELK